MSAAMLEEARVTRRGTLCARSWTDDWVARVEAREDELDRRICGARTIGHAPCPSPSTHPSGRCGHHGGFDLTGAPEGNRNATIHYLYSRRVMPCGQHCPAWRSCPLGGGGPDKGREMLTRAYSDRPACPFEQAEYNAVVTDTLRRTKAHADNAWGIHLAHMIALITVMTSRAARFLATHPFTDDIEVYHGEHKTIEPRLAAAFNAQERLLRELRRWVYLLERCYPSISCAHVTAEEHKRRQTTDTLPDPDALFTAATGKLQVRNRQEVQDSTRFFQMNDQTPKEPAAPSIPTPPSTSSCKSCLSPLTVSTSSPPPRDDEVPFNPSDPWLNPFPFPPSCPTELRPAPSSPAAATDPRSSPPLGPADTRTGGNRALPRRR